MVAQEAKRELPRALPASLRSLEVLSQQDEGYPKACSSGAEGDRTPDLHAASVALSQLSYGPETPSEYRHPTDECQRVTQLRAMARYSSQCS